MCFEKILFRPSQAGVVTGKEGFTEEVAFTFNLNKCITMLVGKMRKGILREDRSVCSSWQGNRVPCLPYIGNIKTGNGN